MQAKFWGDFDDDPYWQSWSMTFIYDTEKATEISVPGGHALEWNSSSGTPSPALLLRGSIEPRTKPIFVDGDGNSIFPLPKLPYDFSITDFTDFRIENSIYVFGDITFYAAGSGGNVFIGEGVDGIPVGFADEVIPFNVNHKFEWLQYGEWDVGAVGGDGPYTYFADVSVLRPSDPVPEPDMWAIMFTGVAVSAAVLRGQKRRWRASSSA
jgi:hypothetical protein